MSQNFNYNPVAGPELNAELGQVYTNTLSLAGTQFGNWAPRDPSNDVALHAQPKPALHL